MIQPCALPELGRALQLDASRPVVFNGRAPLWVFGYLVARACQHPWVALVHPAEGAVVVSSRTADVAVGQVIPLADLGLPPAKGAAPALPEPKSGQVGRRTIALVGPPHSGKSVLARSIYQTLQRRLSPDRFAQCYFLNAAPDGEGQWCHHVRAEVASYLRVKSAFTTGFVAAVADQMVPLGRSCRLVFADLGGHIDRKQQPILNQCTHAAIVSRSTSGMDEWRGAVRVFDLEILAEIETALEAANTIGEPGPPLRCRLGPFQRGEPAPDLPDELLFALLGEPVG